MGYSVERVTVLPTTTDAGATVGFQDSAGTTLIDADSVAGFQVDIDVDETVIQVEVTAQDGVTSQTYTLTATRTKEDLSLSPAASDPLAPFATAVYTIRFLGS